MANIEEKIKILVEKRHIYKGFVTYMCSKLNDLDSIGEIQSALARLKSNYTNYESTQTELEILDSSDVIKNDRYQYEDGFGKVESVLLNKLHALEKASLEKKCNTNDERPKLLKFKMPDVPLVKFDGDKLKWLTFRDVFIDVIHSSKSLSDIEKFYYLHGSIKDGSAYRFIENIPITNENYNAAWLKIHNHYNNEYAIQQHHIRSIYEIKKPVENSHASLNSFVETIEKNLQALESLNVKQDDTLFMNHHIVERLDSISKVEILKKLPLDKSISTNELLELIKSRSRFLENLNIHKVPNQTRPIASGKSQIKTSHVLTTSNASCLYCRGVNHKLTNCSKFSAEEVSPSTRFEFIKTHRLCTNCLSDSHRVLNCPSSNCRKCNLKHHTLLHFSKSKSQNASKESGHVRSPDQHAPSTNLESSSATSMVTVLNDETQSSGIVHSSKPLISNVLTTIQNSVELPDTILATILVWVQSTNGYRIQCRALLDSGSQRNFVTERVCQLLKPSKQVVNYPISGFSGQVSYAKCITNLSVQSRINNYSQDVPFLVVPKICGNLPNSNIDLSNLNCNLDSLPKRILLADPMFYKSESIDLLFGIEMFNDILLSGTFTMNAQLPTFRNSRFGYLVFGKLGQSDRSNSSVKRTTCSIAQLSNDNDLHDLLQKFWQIDKVIIHPQLQWSINERLCEDDYVKNTTRLETGRYSVSLPVKSNIHSLGLSESSALLQFRYLEKRLGKSIELKEQYQSFMREYLELDHMEEVVNPSSNDSQYNQTYFLPHHSVIKESSTTTKLRVVFNASSRTTSQLSLNDVLLCGPTIQQDLFSIVLRFRTHLIGLSADITKMYRQILLHPNQRDLHRIWWRQSEDQNIKCYRLKTVTYGTTCAPFLAIRTLFKLADDEANNLPQASAILKRDFYVDDALTGSDSIESSTEIKNDLKELLSRGGFDLRKWSSNCQTLGDNQESASNMISVLGLNWNTSSDSFCVQIKSSDCNSNYSKRIVLSEIAQLYDPIGFISPVIVTAKQIMQRLWLLSNLSWDDPLPSDIEESWKTFKQQLPLLNSFEIPRCLKELPSSLFEIHAFGDASEKAYGSVVYVRTIGLNNKYVVRLLCSKSKIAPLKPQSIPRLELCAALLNAELVTKVLSSLENVKISKIIYWTDSEVTLGRIKTQVESRQTKLPVFESNRVAKIQELTSSKNWYYVPTSINPADVVSRGASASELISCDLWWNGPPFLLSDESSWPLQKSDNISETVLVTSHETKKSSQVPPTEWDLFRRYSNLFKLLRVTAYLLRFKNNVLSRKRKIPRNIGHLNICEIDLSLKTLIRLSQRVEFSNDIKCLKTGGFVSSKSKLKTFCPFIDNDAIVRIGGRLVNSNCDYNQKHPIVLSGSSSLSKLLVEYEHVKLLHAGPQQLLYNLRQRFWILNGRNLCRKIVHKCLKCFRVKPRSQEQLMGQLPAARVQPSKPFQHVGIDFCGPFTIKYPFRSKTTTKAYVCVYVCFVTRACHLEVVGDLSTQSFLASFRRFTSRRGRCTDAYSDNGTNFVGAKGELESLQQLLNSEYHRNAILKYCTENSIQWHNIPPRSPHFGGLWEAAVKIAKTHMKRVVGDTSFTLEELTTLITEIESCMNSRPLTPMSSDPSDLEVLSPAHFLIGAPLTALPDPNLSHLNYNRLKHYQQIQYLLQQFWKRYQLEVLNELQSRQKWFSQPINLKVGMLVLIKEQNVPPLKWITGRILKLVPGKDGITRTVLIKTQSSTFERAVNNVCVLPIDDDSLNFLENLNKPPILYGSSDYDNVVK